jgi:GNAT superfamily N-acetyltransferase
MSIRPATSDDVPRLAEVLARAFSHDPVTMWHLPDEGSRVQIMRRFFELGLSEEFVPMGAALTTDDLVAACIWVPPDAEQSGGEPEAELPLEELFGEYAQRSEIVVRLLGESHPREPAHFSLPFMGTSPERQGRGLGSAFLRHALAECDSIGIPAYLAASSELLAHVVPDAPVVTVRTSGTSPQPTVRSTAGGGRRARRTVRHRGRPCPTGEPRGRGRRPLPPTRFRRA